MDTHSKLLNQAVRFSLEDSEAQNIITQQSLFDDWQQENPTVSVLNEKSKMSYLEKKEVGLKWHVISLSEYWQNNQILRGLTMNKKMTLGNQDPEFISKWEEILNKCSVDLTWLFIELKKKEAEKVTELQEIKKILKPIMSNMDFIVMEMC